MDGPTSKNASYGMSFGWGEADLEDALELRTHAQKAANPETTIGSLQRAAEAAETKSNAAPVNGGHDRERADTSNNPLHIGRIDRTVSRSSAFGGAAEQLPNAHHHGSSHDSIESMVDEAGTGFYAMCLCLLLRSEISVWKQLMWVGGVIILMLLQAGALFGLIIQVAMPLCISANDCNYDGYFCASVADTRSIWDSGHLTSGCPKVTGNHPAYDHKPYHNTKSFCMECRIPVCAVNQFNGTLALNGPGDDETLQDAREYCFQQHVVSRTSKALQKCYPLEEVKKTSTGASNIVIFLVCGGVAIALMSEKRQILVQDLVLNAALGVHGFENVTKGEFKRVVAMIKAALYAPPSPEDDKPELNHISLNNITNGGDFAAQTWMEPTIPGERTAEIINAIRLLLLYTLSGINYFRRFVILLLVPVSVSSLINFEGSDPLNVLLNGLATVFLLELDDAIGEAAFTASYRGKVSGRLHDIYSHMNELDIHKKFDNSICYIDGFVATLLIFTNVRLLAFTELVNENTCAQQLFEQGCTAMAVHVFVQILENVAQREYFYTKVILKKKSIMQVSDVSVNLVRLRMWSASKQFLMNLVWVPVLFLVVTFLIYVLCELHNPLIAYELFFFRINACNKWSTCWGLFDENHRPTTPALSD